MNTYEHAVAFAYANHSRDAQEPVHKVVDRVDTPLRTRGVKAAVVDFLEHKKSEERFTAQEVSQWIMSNRPDVALGLRASAVSMCLRRLHDGEQIRRVKAPAPGRYGVYERSFMIEGVGIQNFRATTTDMESERRKICAGILVSRVGEYEDT